jgi:glycosyltransferase involved in cell wall biosynthesis
VLKTNDTVIESAQAHDRASVLLLDLSNDHEAALAWAGQQFAGIAIRLLDKAELKWESRRAALARIRALSPRVFAIFTADLQTQSARTSMMLFAALCGAQRIVFGDSNGRSVTRSRMGTLFIEGTRFALELLVGYLLIVPLSWLLTALFTGALIFRPIVRASRRKPLALHSRKNPSLAVRFVRATIVPSLPRRAASGGMASHIAGFTHGAVLLGHGVEFISSGELMLRDAVDSMIIPPSTVISATRALFELWNNLLFTAGALRLLVAANDETDFIYQRYSRFNWTGVVLSLITGLPLALEYNGSEVWIGQHWDPVGQLRLLRRFEQLNLRAAELIFVVSDVQQRELTTAGIEAARLIVNPNGVDADVFHPDCGGREIRRALGLESKVTVGFVGTFGPWHGATVLAQTATQVSQSAGCHFLFIGDGDQRRATESIIDSSGNKSRATFTGRIAHDRVPAYLDVCDILVAPHVPTDDGSEFFGSPTKLFEYLAMARPVVASRLGQIAEVIVDGENGLLIEPNDPAALARAIERLATDQSLRARLGIAARQTVIDRYTWQQNAARVFDQIVKHSA